MPNRVWTRLSFAAMAFALSLLLAPSAGTGARRAQAAGRVTSNGTYSYSEIVQAGYFDPVRYLACAYLVSDDSLDTVATAQLEFTVRPPRFSLRLIPPRRPRRLTPGIYRARVFGERQGTLTVVFQKRRVRRCASTPDGNARLQQVGRFRSRVVPLHPFSGQDFPAGTHVYRARGWSAYAGRIVLCGWIEGIDGLTLATAKVSLRVRR